MINLEHIIALSNTNMKKFRIPRKHKKRLNKSIIGFYYNLSWKDIFLLESTNAWSRESRDFLDEIQDEKSFARYNRTVIN